MSVHEAISTLTTVVESLQRDRDRHEKEIRNLRLGISIAFFAGAFLAFLSTVLAVRD